ACKGAGRGVRSFNTNRFSATAAFPFHAHGKSEYGSKLLGNREHGPHELRDLKIALAAALGRSKFSACPLDREPRSLLGCDCEPVEVVLELSAQLLKRLSYRT
ncbi:hypothetical protein, partial [Bradyrhizobium canariense]|uniref:hypothetical protein n=1 Tax=Bradyrhizobium canariense TaxID=255045 RepID=UPI001AECCB33